jgi:hypothetical protein
LAKPRGADHAPLAQWQSNGLVFRRLQFDSEKELKRGKMLRPEILAEIDLKMPRHKKKGILMGGNMLQARILLAIERIKKLEEKISNLLK